MPERVSNALATYLKDHAAGSAGGADLIDRLARGASSDREHNALTEISAEIESERERLESLMASFGVKPSGFKKLGARLGERLSLPKLHSKSGDARVLQYEAMIMGVTGKLQLWRSLLGLADQGDDRLDQGELATLRDRAESQRARLEALHAQTARYALTD